jgi:hypothetical protein
MNISKPPDCLAHARNPPFSISSYGNFTLDLRVFNLRDVLRGNIYRVDLEVAV